MNISKDLLLKYNQSIPRYTSYPPATAFNTALTNEIFEQELISSNQHSPASISIYIHIPFCNQRCHFCGCNTAIYQGEDRIYQYIKALKKEIQLRAELIDKNRLVTQVCWGGGTPNSINLDYVAEIMNLLYATFSFADYAEIAMECSPAYLDFKDIDSLHKIGFNRISLGVQDFHDDVLNAINRKTPLLPLKDTIAYMRSKGMKGLNIDLVYGLPLQTIESFRENIQQVLEIKPDRIATFSYAHVPWVNPEQKRLEKFHIPEPEEKIQMLVNSINELSQNGYDIIGMDHFALYDDELSIAKQEKTLHRNFQGYCTRKTTGQVYAFGASGISQLHNCYAQNIKSTYQYVEAIEKNGSAIERGYILNENEIVVREIINQIMCNGEIDLCETAKERNISLDELVEISGFNQNNLSKMIEDGLLHYDKHLLQVSELGMLMVRNIAAQFDPALNVTNHKQFSKTI